MELYSLQINTEHTRYIYRIRIKDVNRQYSIYTATASVGGQVQCIPAPAIVHKHSHTGIILHYRTIFCSTSGVTGRGTSTSSGSVGVLASTASINTCIGRSCWRYSGGIRSSWCRWWSRSGRSSRGAKVQGPISPAMGPPTPHSATPAAIPVR